MDKAIDQLEKLVLSDSANPVRREPHPSYRLLTGLKGNDKSTPELTGLVRVLMGISEVSDPEKIDSITFFDDSLNQSQRDAIRFAMEAREVACIHGPPGKRSHGIHHSSHTVLQYFRRYRKDSHPN